MNEAAVTVAEALAASGEPCGTSFPERGAQSRGGTPLLQVRDLWVQFRSRGQWIPAVSGLSYGLDAGRSLAIIGESGAGKSLSCRALIGLLPSDATVSGSICFAGKQLVGLTAAEMRRHRGADIAMVFQDSDQALNSTMRIGHQITEAIREHDRVSRRAAKVRAVELLRLLRMPAPEQRFDAYPHQLSGGMRQRVMIAIALAGNPRLLIADESTRALDTLTQAQIVGLLGDLQRELGMAVILISHDLALAARFADDVLVMHSGTVVEYARSRQLFVEPRVPYTRALLDAIPGFEPSGDVLPVVERQGSAPPSGRSESGCSFEPRCSRARELCARARPSLVEQENGHHWRCWYPLASAGRRP